MLLETPTSYSTRFPGKTLPEAIKANKRLKQPFPTLAPKTINDKWISHVGAVFQWAANNEIVPDNPCSKVRVDEGKGDGKRSRVPFTPGDLAKMFAHRLFDDPSCYGERQWAVLIGLFTGMRAGEIAQLPLDGIRHERGVLVFGTAGKLKNEGSRRIVPVHSKLVELGLEQRIQMLRTNRETYLFPEWHARGEAIMARAAAKGQVVQMAFAQVHGRYFNRFLLPEAGIHDRRKTFHSLRHTFKSALALAGVSREISDTLTGHRDQTAGAIYVHSVSVEKLKQGIETLDFDLQLPKLGAEEDNGSF